MYDENFLVEYRAVYLQKGSMGNEQKDDVGAFNRVRGIGQRHVLPVL